MQLRVLEQLLLINNLSHVSLYICLFPVWYADPKQIVSHTFPFIVHDVYMCFQEKSDFLEQSLSH